MVIAFLIIAMLSVVNICSMLEQSAKQHIEAVNNKILKEICRYNNEKGRILNLLSINY